MRCVLINSIVVKVVGLDQAVEARVGVSDAWVGREQQEEHDGGGDDERTKDHEEALHVGEVLNQHAHEPVDWVDAAVEAAERTAEKGAGRFAF